jgi:hypothetical protein
MRQGKRIPRGDGPSLPVVPLAVARWATKVTAMATRLGPHDARAESRQRALADVQGLLSPIARQTGWQLAEQAGARQPDTFPHRLHRRLGSADAVRDDLRRYVRAPLGAPQAVQIVDATGFLKSGPKSAGVARPSAGPAGKIDHGQSGVFLAYARPTGRTGLDRERDLPQAWWADRRAVTGPGCLPRSHAIPHRRGPKRGGRGRRVCPPRGSPATRCMAMTARGVYGWNVGPRPT